MNETFELMFSPAFRSVLSSSELINNITDPHEFYLMDVWTNEEHYHETKNSFEDSSHVQLIRDGSLPALGEFVDGFVD